MRKTKGNCEREASLNGGSTLADFDELALGYFDSENIKCYCSYIYM